MTKQQPTGDGSSPAALIGPTLRRQWRLIAVGATCGIVWMAGFAAAPIAVGRAVDDAIEGVSSGRIAFWVLIVSAILLVSAIAGAVRHYCAVSLWVNSSLMTEAHVTDRVLDRRGGVEEAAGTLVSLSLGDARKIATIADLTNRGTGAVVVLVGSSVWMVIESPTLAALVLLVVPLSLFAVAPFLATYDRRATEERRRLAEATAAAADGITGLRTAQGIGGERNVRTWFRARSAGMHDAALSLVRVESSIFVAVGFLPVLALIPVLWVGGGMAIDGAITPGTLVTFVGLTEFLVTPISTVGEVAQVVTAGRASAKRILEVTEQPHDIPDGSADSSVPPFEVRVPATLGFHRVEASEFGPFDVQIEAGETVGIATASSRDAAMLGKLLARRLDPSAGVVTVGDRALTSIPLVELPAHVTLVDTERPWLMTGTLRDNLLLAGSSDDDRLGRVLHAAAADDITARPNALDRELGERGLRLSGGQRQRLAVAQALLARTAVVALVEPSSALDAATEAVLAERLVAADRPTTIVVTTSPTLLAECDRVIWVADGVVQAEGAHAALLRGCSDYASLVLG